MQVSLIQLKSRRLSRAVVLAEAVIAVALSAMMASSILYGSLVASRKLAWASHSSVAQAVAAGAIEQGFSYRWTPESHIDEMTNLVLVQTNVYVMQSPATNYLSYYTYFTDPTNNIDDTSTMLQYRSMQSSCVWVFQNTVYTNTIIATRAPNFE